LKKNIKRAAMLLTLSFIMLLPASLWADMLADPQTTRTTIAGNSIVLGDHLKCTLCQGQFEFLIQSF